MLDDAGLFRACEDSPLRREDVFLRVCADHDVLRERLATEAPTVVLLPCSGTDLESLITACAAGPDRPAILLICSCPPGTVHDWPCEAAPAAQPERVAASLSRLLDLSVRGDRRRPCRLRGTATRGEERRVGTARELSEGGVFLLLGDPWDAGESVIVTLAGGGERRRLPGVIVRAVRPVGGGTGGMAVRFDAGAGLSAASVEALVRPTADEESSGARA